MELCSTCKRVKCNKSIVIIKQENMKIIKCIEYEKDEKKIKGYVRPLKRTAKLQPLLFEGFISDWRRY